MTMKRKSSLAPEGETKDGVSVRNMDGVSVREMDGMSVRDMDGVSWEVLGCT